MTGCVKSQGIYNPLCCTAQAVYSLECFLQKAHLHLNLTAALSCLGQATPNSHQPKYVRQEPPPVHAPWICSKSELCLVFFTHQPHQYCELHALNFWLLSHDFYSLTVGFGLCGFFSIFAKPCSLWPAWAAIQGLRTKKKGRFLVPLPSPPHVPLP